MAHSYFEKARKRLRALTVLFEDEAYSDVVREAQELVELASKGMLRFIGVEPPKQHDVGRLLIDHRDRLPVSVAGVVDRLADISLPVGSLEAAKPDRDLRSASFYGPLPVGSLEAAKSDRLLGRNGHSSKISPRR